MKKSDARFAVGPILAATVLLAAGCTHAVYVKDTPTKAGGDIHKIRYDGRFDSKYTGLPDHLRMPALSLDKKDLVFAKMSEDFDLDLHVAKNAKNPKNITEDECWVDVRCHESNPDWSPDGKTVVFEVEAISSGDGQVGPGEIAITNANGSGGMTNLTSDGTADDKEPAWGASAKSGRIAFTSNRSGDFKIYTMKADGSDVQLVPGQGPGNNEQPDWCAETDLQTIDHAIAFVSNRDGNAEIYIVDYGVPNPQVGRLTNSPARDASPTCLIGGVAFISDRSGTREIWKVPYSGGAAAALVQNNKNKSDLN